MTIPDFDQAERDLVARLLERRYGKPVAIELAEAELALDPARKETTACPTLYWNERCTLELLRVQADHEKQSAGVSSGATAADLADEEYLGPPSL